MSDEKPWLQAAPEPVSGPRPGGWRSGVERVRAREALGAVLTAFGIEEARKRLSGRRRSARIDSESTSLDRGQLELWESRVLVAETARALEELRPRHALTPTEYARRWRAIIAKWNAAIAKQGWRDLPPLCEICGLPVLARQSTTDRVMKRGKLVETRVTLSTVCSEACREARKGKRRTKSG